MCLWEKAKITVTFHIWGLINHLEMVQTYKYLGVWLSTNRIYNKARQAQANQGRKRYLHYKDYLQS